MKLISTQVKEVKNKYKNIQSAYREAERTLNKVFYHPKFKSFIRMKQDNIISNLNEIKVGNIYTFEYKEPKYKDVLDFYNTRPNILLVKTWYCENTKNYLADGINLNFIPSDIRTVILDLVYKYFKKHYNKEGYKNKPKGVITNFGGIYTLLQVILKNLTVSGFEFAYRRYIFDIINEMQHIHVPYWKDVALFESKEIVGAYSWEVFELYQNYIKKQK